MNQHVNAISGRLSLRAPQKISLEILSRVCELVPPKKGTDVEAALKAIREEFESVEDFERAFPSLCFALATGVGKTRLMGAFISYLYQAKNIRHFFVLAPNLTIYNKLVADFTPNTPKYVFQGISEFAITPPQIITGDNYESGRGVRKGGYLPGVEWEHEVHVNIFNISKINSEVRGGKAPRIKRLSEYIGESYFDYLSKLEDLVLIMDESHRYRATAGINAINELSPVMGLELTATPQIERGSRTEPFKNVIYSYPLSAAMEDGFVKEPAVATRENFDVSSFDDTRLERLKLEDGIRIHEKTKIELEIYSRQNNKPIVKPFMLVVARDTGHAGALVKTIEDDKFFGGEYKGRVITVHSKQSGQEKDDVVEQLMTVEHSDNPTEIVVHVNMLKEGWDVTNLYTIVPLRAANSKTLVEQSIGRGLRLPYGKRTGVAEVDRLTIVSHDKFQEIVDYANSPDSVIRGGLKVVYISDERSKLIVAEPEIMQRINAESVEPDEKGKSQPPPFKSEREREVARATMDVIRRDFGRLPTASELLKPGVQKEIVEKVKEAVAVPQGELEGVVEKVDVEKVVAEATTLRNELSIDIPRITVQPVGKVTRRYKDFDLDLASVRLEPVESDILIKELQSQQQARLEGGLGRSEEERLENYVIRGLIDFDDICYDEHADLLYKFATQAVEHLRSYLKSDEKVENVLLFHQRQLVDLIHLQMQDHFEEKATEYEAHCSGGITPLPRAPFKYSADETERDFRAPVEDRQAIRKMIFVGFNKCLYKVQKFDSDSERRFAVILENDETVLKWFKPSRGVFKIHCRARPDYEPDFVVETGDCKYLCEPKRASEMKDPEVLEKASAAVTFCKNATEHELKHGGKPWHYLLIPHDKIADNMTLEGLVDKYEVKAE